MTTPAEPTPADDKARRVAIEDELRRLEESAMYSGQIQFEETKIWRRVNLTLGIPASVLAAVAGQRPWLPRPGEWPPASLP